MAKRFPINIPNLLSLYRLISFPFILILALNYKEKHFSWFLLINLITDVADGLIARAFKMETPFGAKLDSIADFGTFLLALIGIYIFKADDFAPHLISFGVFIGLFILSHLLALIKFKQMPSLHLYSWKIGGYIQGSFFAFLFMDQFYTPYYYVMLIWSYFAFTEHIVIQLLINKMKSNAKGLYWVLKDKTPSD